MMMMMMMTGIGLLMASTTAGDWTADRPVWSGVMQDLTAVGITRPGVRKRLTAEIGKLSIGDGIPQLVPVGTLPCHSRIE